MLTSTTSILFALLSTALAQYASFRFDHAIHHLSRFRQFSPAQAKHDASYDFSAERILQDADRSRLSNATSECERQFDALVQAAMQGEMWAVKVLDAWAKPLPSGVLKGNTYWVGSYDECVHPMYWPANKTFIPQPFDSQHCMIAPKTAQNNPNAMPEIVLGICVPMSCDHRDVVVLIDKYLKRANVTESQLTCSGDPANGQRGLTNGAIATIVVLSLLGALVLLGTIADLLLRTNVDSVGPSTANINGHSLFEGSQPRKTLREGSAASASVIVSLSDFSAIRSLRRIFTLQQKNDDDSFLFINGIRVLALCWVIIGHSLVFGLFYTQNVLDVLVWTHNPAFQLVTNAVFSVDTFFVLSGFLTAVLFVRQVKKEKKLSMRTMVLYYVHRYIRLTPTFLLMILISINLTPYFGSGPAYPTQQGFETADCRTRDWWTSILYIGNIVKPNGMCLGIAWYLHNDMQFHWIAPLTLVPFALGRKFVSVFVATVFVFIGIVSILSILIYYPDMPLNSLVAFGQTDGPNFFNDIYITPWCRISAYAVGLLTGYLVLDTGRQYRMRNSVRLLGTVVTVLFAVACLFTTYPDYILPSGQSRTILVAYQSLSRTLWSVAIGWLLFLCSINQGGIVNRILSWAIWAPMARLNYSCYLVHATIIYLSIFNQREPLYYQGHVVVNGFAAHIVFSYMAAVIVMVFIETPFFIIEKKLLKR